MPHVVNTDALLAEGILSQPQADLIIQRSRETMLALVVNIVLCGGIIAASLGFVFWIADAVGVALLGAAFLAIGLGVLLKAGPLYRLLGHAGTLVGAGMLFSGAGIELIDKYPDIAAWIMVPLGAVAAGLAALAFHKSAPHLRFSIGAIGLMGVALHLAGAFYAIVEASINGLPLAAFYLYATALVAGAGLFTNVRFVTALAIVPFAQMLDTGTAYWHATFVFYSPEATFTILQMSTLIAASVWVISRTSDRIGRHAGILAIMAAVVGNLAFLVGSLWGDDVAISYFRDQAPNYQEFDGDWSAYNTAREAWEATFFHISEHVFSVVWGVLLIVGAWFAAINAKRGLFNASVTFLGIHAYTQMFETFSDEPMVYALGGLAAIPLAWGLWRLNHKMFGAPEPA